MDFKYQLIGETKRYAKYEPSAEAMTLVTGNFYLALDDFRQMGSPEVVTLRLIVDDA